jgi:DNA-binding protein HU-beta
VQSKEACTVLMGVSIGNSRDLPDRSNFSKADTKKFLDAYVEVVTLALQSGEEVQLIGFLGMSVVDRAERVGRNPRSGEEITIPASKVVKFTTGKQLKEAINA